LSSRPTYRPEYGSPGRCTPPRPPRIIKVPSPEAMSRECRFRSAHAEVECRWMKAPQRLRLSGLDAKPASMWREAMRVSLLRTQKAERQSPPCRPHRTMCIVQQGKDWGLRSTILRRSTRMPSARPQHARSLCHAQRWPCADQSETANRREIGRYGRPVTVRSA
jgi:hypothetical protein